MLGFFDFFLRIFLFLLTVVGGFSTINSYASIMVLASKFSLLLYFSMKILQLVYVYVMQRKDFFFGISAWFDFRISDCT